MMFQETSRTLSSRSQQLSKIPETVPKVSRISEVIPSCVVSDHLRKVGEIFHRKVQCWAGEMTADVSPPRRTGKRNSITPPITRLEGLVIKEGILPELSESDITLHRVIGTGAYGEVYHATLRDHAADTSRPVAVKTMKCCRVEKVAAFLRELHILRLCGKHPNIIQFHGALTSNNSTPKVVFQLCNRGDLFSLISTCKQCHDKKSVYGLVDNNIILTFRRIFRILRETAKGLEYLHSVGVIHRDISARNVLLDESFRPKISDFGLSTHHGDVRSRHPLSQGVVIPIRWSAPELVTERSYSYRSDIWSLGILMGEVVSYGEVPWAKHTEQDIRRAMERRCSPEPPHNSYYTLQLLIRQCWDYEPSNRPELNSLAESLGRINVMST